MEILISWRHREPIKPFEEYINKKISHLEKFSRRIAKSIVILNQEGTRNVVELKIKLNKAPSFLIKEEGYDIRNVVDACIHKAERKVKQYERKVRQRKK
jgi:ribosomal subunit interface protein